MLLLTFLIGFFYLTIVFGLSSKIISLVMDLLNVKQNVITMAYKLCLAGLLFILLLISIKFIIHKGGNKVEQPKPAISRSYV